ncbi:MAG: branched-chain amino acid transporter AzlD [Erysipelotrichia bacterium]|nr:branched-chain amino acid transporter AzlD [Erysipelotrichia bacterium]
MTLIQQIITIGLCIAATMCTRFLPFLLFRENQSTPAYIIYLGKALPSAVFAMLAVYCLKNTDVISGTHGLPELLAIAVTAAVHIKWRNMFLSMLAGTAAYMILIQFIF